MNPYIGHSDMMAESADFLAKLLGANHGPVSKAPSDSIIFWLGVPGENVTRTKRKTFKSLVDIRKLYKNKKSVLDKLNKGKEREEGDIVLAYIFNNEIVAVVTQSVKTRKDLLREKLGQDLADELIANGDIKEPNEEMSSEDRADMYTSTLDQIRDAVESIHGMYDACVYALKCTVGPNNIYFDSMLMSPSLRKGKGVIAKKIADKIS